MSRGKKENQVEEIQKETKSGGGPEVQVLEIPESSNWLASSDLGAKIDDLRTRYVIKAIHIIWNNNVVIEFFK